MSRCPARRRCGRSTFVGCDGGRSLVRRAAGIDFPGWDPSVSWLIAEVETKEELRRSACAAGVVASVR